MKLNLQLTSRMHFQPIYKFCAPCDNYYASGNFQAVTGDLHNISQPSVSHIITRVSTALGDHCQNVIKFPASAEQQQVVKEGFYDYQSRRIPRVIGCVDGSLIPIRGPSEDKDTKFFLKNFHAIIVQAICDHNSKFTNVIVKWARSTHDAFMWNSNKINEIFEEGLIRNGFLLGDSA